jgi:sulfoxide reductase heme-binding subunit YedZ
MPASTSRSSSRPGFVPQMQHPGRAGIRRRAPQIGAIALASAPLLVLGVRAATGRLSANPIEDVTHATGEWTLRLLILTLAVTPLRRWLGWKWLAPLRRTLGLAAFGWACLHLLTWVVLDQFFDWRAMLEDVLERRFISAGMLAFLCLVPLAITSTRAWMKRLGPHWIRLHRLAYVAALLGVLHYVWLAKTDLLEPLVYATILGLLLGSRIARLPRPRPAAVAGPLHPPSSSSADVSETS